MCATLVAKGAVMRAKGGYEVARVTVNGENSPSLPLHYHHSKSEESEGGHPRARAGDAGPTLRVVPAEPTRWANPCRWYRDHQSKHRQTPSGWTCDACHPEEDTTA